MSSPASDPKLALKEWLATRDPDQFTHRVRTCYDWAVAWQLARNGWHIDTAGWQRRSMAYPEDKGGWVIVLSKPITGEIT